MANYLIPVAERTLTPDEVELLDRRRRRGHFLLNVGFQTSDHRDDRHGVGRPGSDLLARLGASDGVLGCVPVYGVYRLLFARPAFAPWPE